MKLFQIRQGLIRKRTTMQCLQIMWYVHFEILSSLHYGLQDLFPVGDNISIVKKKSCSTNQNRSVTYAMIYLIGFNRLNLK